jgi:hypothetical protein
MRTIITNAFSINMLLLERLDLHFKPLTLAEAKEFAAEAESAVGHVDTAAVFGAVLGMPIAYNRINVTLEKHKVRLLIGQYTGPRLEVGATRLPEGAEINWWLVT